MKLLSYFYLWWRYAIKDEIREKVNSHIIKSYIISSIYTNKLIKFVCVHNLYSFKPCVYFTVYIWCFSSVKYTITMNKLFICQDEQKLHLCSKPRRVLQFDQIKSVQVYTIFRKKKKSIPCNIKCGSQTNFLIISINI